MILLILLLCLFPLAGHAATYGQINEVASTTGNLFVDANLSADCTSGNYSIANRNCTGANGNAYTTGIEGFTNIGQGQTLFFRAGTYNFGGSYVNTPNGTSEANRITIKPYNAETVNITGRFNVKSFFTFAGFQVTSGGAQLFRVNTTTDQGAIIRNNHLRTAGAANSSVFEHLGNAYSNITFSGNLIELRQGDTASAFNISYASGLIDSNKFIDSTTSGAQDNIKFRCNPQGGWRGSASETLRITNNWFDSNSDENFLDICNAANGATANVIVGNNFFNGLGIGSVDACVISSGHPDNSSINITYENNYFYRCSTRALNLSNGSATTVYHKGGFIVRNNVFEGVSPDVDGSSIDVQIDDLVFEHNTVYRSNIDFSSGSENDPINLTFRSNILVDADLTGVPVGSITCTHNNLFSSDAMPFSCTNGTTTDPSFVAVASKNFNITASIAAGHDGEVRGALSQPRVGSCNVGNVAATTMTAEVTSPVSPVAVLDSAKLDPQKDDVTQTFTGTSISGSTQVRITGLPAYGPSPVDADLRLSAQGALRDSRNIGGPEVGLHGQSVATTSDVQCTNTVVGGGSLTYTCTVGDTNRDKVDVTVNVQGAPPLILGSCPTGWNVTDDGVNQTENTCTLTGPTTFQMDLAANLTAGTNNLVYDATTGDTRNSAGGGGTEVGSATVTCINNIGTSPPTIISAQVLNSERGSVYYLVDIGGGDNLEPLTGMTGITVQNHTVTQCDAVEGESNRFKCMVTPEFVAAEVATTTYTQASGNITVDAVELAAFTIGVDNDVQTDVGSVLISHIRFEYPNYLETASRQYAAEDDPFLYGVPGGIIRARVQLKCTGTCEGFAYVPYAKLNGGTSIPIPDSEYGANGVRLATDTKLVTALAPTTRQLTSCTLIGGVIYLPPLNAFPTVAFASDTECAEYVFNFQLDPTLVGLQFITIGMQRNGGGFVDQSMENVVHIIGDAFSVR